MRIVVEKYHGLGNDYLVYDPNKNKLKLTPSNVQLMCNRNFGVGADGILRACLLKGGELDLSKAAAILLDDFRSGRLGRITLEVPKLQGSDGNNQSTGQEEV